MIGLAVVRHIALGASLSLLLAFTAQAQMPPVEAGPATQAAAPVVDEANAQAAREAFDALIERYRSLKSYRDKIRMEARLEWAAGGEPEIGAVEGSLVFLAPNKLVSRMESAHVYYDGERLTQYWPSGRQYTQKTGEDVLDTLRLDRAPSTPDGGPASHPLAVILADHDVNPRDALCIAEVSSIKPDEYEGESGQTLSGRLRLPMIPGKGLIPFTAFISDETKLLRVVRADASDVARAMAEEEARDGMPAVKKAEIVLMFDDVEVDADIPEDDLTFDAEGAQKVQMYGYVAERGIDPLDLLGQPAPSLAGPTYAGETFDLADKKGQPTLIVFWGTWSIDRERVLRDAQQFATQYAEQSLLVVGVNCNGEGGQDAVKRVLDASGAKFVQVLDRDGELSKNWHVAGLPTVVLLNGEGDVVEAYSDWSETECTAAGKQLAKLTQGEAIYTADELQQRRNANEDLPHIGHSLIVPDEAPASERLVTSDVQLINGSKWNMTQQDIDGDGEIELLVPDWNGGVSVVKPSTGEVRRLSLRNLKQVSIQNVQAVRIDGETCWLVGGMKHSTMSGGSYMQQGFVRLYAPDGEILWGFEPSVGGENSSQCIGAGGDLDGDGRVEYAIGLTTYEQHRIDENSWTTTNQNGSLIILNDRGEVIALRDIEQRQIEFLYVASGKAGGPQPLLCFAGGQIEWYTLRTEPEAQAGAESGSDSDSD